MKDGYDDWIDDEINTEHPEESKYYIRGTISDNDGTISEPVLVRLINESDEDALIIEKIITNGEYSFDKPNEGDVFHIEIVYGLGKYNWQDYEQDENCKEFSEETDRSRLNDKPINNVLYKNYDRVKKALDNIPKDDEDEYIAQVKDAIKEEEAKADEERYVVKAVSGGTHTAKKDEGETIPAFILKERTYNKIKVEKQLTKAKVVLSDGTSLREEDYSSLPSNENNRSSLPAYWYIDDEIMHGATINLEYKITVQSDAPLTDVVLIDYLSYGNSNLLFDKNAQMLSDVGTEHTNDQSSWEQINKGDVETLVKNGNITFSEGKVYLKNKINLSQWTTDPTVEMQYEKTIYLTVSKLVTNADPDLTYDNAVEVVQYTNNGKIAGIEKNNYTYAEPGSYNPNTENQADINTRSEGNNLGVDFDDARVFIITKPTGGQIGKMKSLNNIFERIKIEGREDVK